MARSGQLRGIFGVFWGGYCDMMRTGAAREEGMGEPRGSAARGVSVLRWAAEGQGGGDALHLWRLCA